MIVLSPAQARAWEEKSLREGARMKDLMRQAVEGALREIRPHLPSPGHALFLVGPGHNGDDAVLLALELKELGWKTELLLSRAPGKRLHPDPRVKAKVWKKALVWPAKPAEFLKARGPRLVVDGLLGLGAVPPPRPPETAILNWITKERRGTDLFVALDLPTGLHPSEGHAPGAVFSADFTMALGSIKSGCLKDLALPQVGRLRGVPIDFGVPPPKTTVDFFLPTEAASFIQSRRADLHKHSAGTVHLWAGSGTYPGASLLASVGALRSGAGYVRLFTDRSITSGISSRLPELLLSPHADGTPPDLEAFCKQAKALVVGPGLPPSETLSIFLSQLLAASTVPVVLDAGALDLVAAHPEWLTSAKAPVILTPHAGELARLTGQKPRDRAEAARLWLDRHPHTVLVAKGPHTLVASSDHSLSHNSTGGPAQATAGMGDLLAGLIGGLLATGYTPFDAARLAVSWHGLAADLAEGQGGPMVLASDVARQLPKAWRVLKGQAISERS
jgi:NAD(P)H-hydrate epimerase